MPLGTHYFCKFIHNKDLFFFACQFAFDANGTLACVRGDAIQPIVLVIKPSTLLNKVLKKILFLD